MIMLGKLNKDSRNGIYKVTTESGSTYQMTVADGKGYVQRLPGNESSNLRRDSENLTLLETVEIEIGKPGYFALEPLGEGFATVRITTPVISIEHIE